MVDALSFERFLVTGGAGFIGSHLVDRLLAGGARVLCIDDFNDYYDPQLKRANVAPHLEHPAYTLAEQDIRDAGAIRQLVAREHPEVIIHLAARAGVRPSLEEPFLYETTNVAGTLNLLDAAREVDLSKFVFGSSSSVYGLNTKVPFAEDDQLHNPASPYAATKIAGEALCNVYAHLYGFPVISLRFFTVYGPRQRPDLAIRKFAQRILAGESIDLFGDGSSSRDYTFVDDIVDGILSAVSYEGASHEIFNLGNSNPIALRELVATIEEVVGSRAEKVWLPQQPGDVPITYADLTRSRAKLGYEPKITFSSGIRKVVDWLRES
jgi:UDP-glucuronate 4-epimerase